jgi:hypothetical protein
MTVRIFGGAVTQRLDAPDGQFPGRRIWGHYHTRVVPVPLAARLRRPFCSPPNVSCLMLMRLLPWETREKMSLTSPINGTPSEPA